jgi:hypothetical protein
MLQGKDLHGEIITKSYQLKTLLKFFKLELWCWGRIGIKDINNHMKCIANNMETIYEAEQWVNGYIEAYIRLTDKKITVNDTTYYYFDDFLNSSDEHMFGFRCYNGYIPLFKTDYKELIEKIKAEGEQNEF